MENEPHEYVVTKMYAHPDEDVRPLDVRIECATDRGRIILRAKSVMVQQLLTDGLSSRQRLATWTAEEIDRAIDLSVNALPDLRDILPFLKEVQSKVNARIVRQESKTSELAGSTIDPLNDTCSPIKEQEKRQRRLKGPAAFRDNREARKPMKSTGS
jgi:hypothetical protein